MNDFFHNQKAESGHVECLGQTFPNEQARREHFRVPPAKLQNALDKAAGSLPRSNICTFS
ncbi:MAG: hypothetical protein V5B33_16260 [Candidatus Accumulibacter sp. UW20]|jgi:hypothetical protein